ncbi:dihydrofolate reductase family protein [Egicoccus halophilus]|uniref:Bacterial bifunctional deaminase-reductase C-terminal domain-containing protein n=1 Tax=Egicoccus halophilus TaxID=1670830 RepID=A0A8J3A8V3_9ACTN|nr:dihydrofolate reductase family protein [Egicoccus halophilus]GGI04939.1 hypothetical protein GCM10011354_11600 [Egicoccus halophilus]
MRRLVATGNDGSGASPRDVRPEDVRLEDVYADLVLCGPVEGRAAVSLGMVASTDGAASIDGRTARLGGVADRAAFAALRAAGDAVLVGAGTVRAEDYRPVTGDTARRARRRAKGLAPVPRLVIVSRSLSLSPTARVFADPRHPPLLITTRRAIEQTDVPLPDAAELIVCGEEEVDLALALRELAERGLPRVLCEGGPRLNDALLGADLVDEVFLTLAPVLVGGNTARIVTGPAEHPPAELHLVELREHEGELLLRYRRNRGRERGEPADRL